MNFRLYSGLYVEITKELKAFNGDGPTLKEGEIHQVLNVPRMGTPLTFVGVQGRYSDPYLVLYLKPLYKSEK